MGQILQDRKKVCFMSFFLKSMVLCDVIICAQMQTWIDPHLVRFVASSENSSKNIAPHVGEDNGCTSDCQDQECNNNGSSEVSQKVNHLKSFVVSTVKEVSTVGKSKEDGKEKNNGQCPKEIDEVNPDSTKVHIEEISKPDNQAEGNEGKKALGGSGEGDEVAEGGNCSVEKESREEKREDAVMDQFDRMAGEHIPFSHCFFLVPDAALLSSQAFLSSLPLQKQVGIKPRKN